ncbi:MAG: hypothetical protein U9N49_12965, partial [Campylobacterota bacterium]|nr:hypothetical protein [Campylobacterota bacterium]
EILATPVVHVFGSGAEPYRTLETEYNKKGNVYSRDKFKCLYEMVKNQKDKFSYGPLQLARIYRNGDAKPIGFIDNSKKYLYGEEITNHVFNSRFEWRNKNFEVCDPKTLQLKDGEQAQP